MTSTNTTLAPYTRRHLGRHLAALYDSLPPAPASPRLAAALGRLGDVAAGDGQPRATGPGCPTGRRE